MKGWRNDSYRHHLAAKGVKTGRKKYYSLFIDHSKEFDKTIRQGDVSRKQSEILNKLDDAVNKQELTSENRSKFMKDEFFYVARDYEKGLMSLEQFTDEVDSKFNYFLKTNSKKLKVFEW